MATCQHTHSHFIRRPSAVPPQNRSPLAEDPLWLRVVLVRAWTWTWTRARDDGCGCLRGREPWRAARRLFPRAVVPDGDRRQAGHGQSIRLTFVAPCRVKAKMRTPSGDQMSQSEISIRAITKSSLAILPGPIGLGSTPWSLVEFT